MKKNKYLFFSILILLFILLFLYYKNFFKKNNIHFAKDYKYGVIHTSIKNDSSTISIYDSNGAYIDNKKINIGGISLASFLQYGISNNDKFYLPSPVLANKGQNFILEIDKQNLNYRKIGNKDTKTPTFFSVDDNFAYLSVSLNTTTVSKVDLSNNNTVISTELEGSGHFSIEKYDKIYLATVIDNQRNLPFSRIYTLDKSNLNILNKIDINNVQFIQDMLIYNNSLYILIYSDSTGLSNRLVEINLENNLINEISIPFKYLKKLYAYDNNLLIIQGDPNFREQTENKIARINLDNNNLEVFETSNIHSSTYIDNEFLYSSEGNFIYIYNLSDFKLLNKFKIKEIDNERFVSLFIK